MKKDMTGDSAIDATLNVVVGPASLSDLTFTRGKQWRSGAGYLLEFTHSGNLELRTPSGELMWQTVTQGSNAAFVTLRRDGSLTVCDYRGCPVWSSGSRSHQNPSLVLSPSLVLQDDGNLVIYAAGRPIWETGTYGETSMIDAMSAPDGTVTPDETTAQTDTAARSDK